MNNQKIGAFIAQLRRGSGYTQSALAQQLNISNRTVSKWENGDGLPDISVLPELASLLGVSVDELLRGEKNEETRIKVEEVASEKNLLNLFHICFIVSCFSCAFGALLGSFNSLYCMVSFRILFYTHWEIIFAAVSFVAVVFGNLLFCISAMRLNVLYSAERILLIVYRKAMALLLMSYLFVATFLLRIADHYLHHLLPEAAVLAFITLCLLLACVMIGKRIKKKAQ